MNKAIARIERSSVDNKFIWTFHLNDELQQGATAVTGLGAAFSAVQPLLLAVTGTTRKVTIALENTNG